MTATGRAIIPYSATGSYYTDEQLTIAALALWDFTAKDVILEQHVGGGAWAEAALQLRARPRVYATDVNPNAVGLTLPGLAGARVRDALAPLPATWPIPTWIVGNPPYSITVPVLDKAGQQKRHPETRKRGGVVEPHPKAGELVSKHVETATRHVAHALELTGRHVLYLLPVTFLGGRKRLALFARRRLRSVTVLVPRPSFTGSGTDSNEYGLFWFDREWTRGGREDARISWLEWKGPASAERPEARRPRARARSRAA